VIDRRAVPVALAVPVLAGGALLLSAGGAFASPQPLTTTLNASNEVAGGQAGSTGSAKVTVDPDTGQVCVTVTSSVTNAVAMHIHKGAAGVDGPVVVPLDPKAVNGDTSCVKADAALAGAIAADPAGYYLNIHTPAKPAGALRGQLSGGTGGKGPTPTGVNAGSGGQAGTAPDRTAELVVLMLAGAGVAGTAGWRLVRR
jgi:CHRD domain